MATEYEATFIDINKEEMRNRLRSLGAQLKAAETIQRRVVFDLPQEKHAPDVWARVRDEGDKITMSWKRTDGGTIESQKEICITVNSFDDAVEMLKELGCKDRSYQETLRETWALDDSEITIDTWPFLEPLVEIEGPSEDAVRAVAAKLEFDWTKALFCTSSKVYKMKYGEDKDVTHIPRLTFEMPNPFV